MLARARDTSADGSAAADTEGAKRCSQEQENEINAGSFHERVFWRVMQRERHDRI